MAPVSGRPLGGEGTSVKRAAAITGVLVVVFIVLPLGYLRFRPAGSVLTEFFDARNKGEDQLADPLILSGCRVANEVTRRLANPGMPLRRYAIGYLGNRRCATALPVLTSILHAESEKDYFRSDALEAIAQIDRTQGQELAANYKSRDDYLGERARAILAGENIGLQRTYWQALRGVHE